MAPRLFKGRKLLIASIGVAAVTYACNKEADRPQPVGNLMPPMPYDSGSPEPTTGASDAGGAGKLDDIAIASGNLMAPPPMPVPDAGAKGTKPDAGKKK